MLFSDGGGRVGVNRTAKIRQVFACGVSNKRGELKCKHTVYEGSHINNLFLFIYGEQHGSRRSEQTTELIRYFEW